MRTKTVLAVVVAFGLVGAFASVGHAGGGAGGPGGQPLFQCWGVEQGDRPPQVLSVNDQFTNPTNERLGKLKMVCAPADFTVVNNAGIRADINGDHLTCYQADDAQATPSVVTLTDTFGSQTVTVRGESKFLCTLAEKQCHSGCPILGTPAH